MSMSHKAFAFDWDAFDSDLAPILIAALNSDDGTELTAFIDQERVWLTDPYDGVPLPHDWQQLLEVADVQEIADFALTRYYRVQDDFGVGSSWLSLTEKLSGEQEQALLGVPFGTGDQLFDPGRLGSYFQSQAMACRSVALLESVDIAEIHKFRMLLAEYAAQGLGVYVTF